MMSQGSLAMHAERKDRGATTLAKASNPVTPHRRRLRAPPIGRGQTLIDPVRIAPGADQRCSTFTKAMPAQTGQGRSGKSVTQGRGCEIRGRSDTWRRGALRPGKGRAAGFVSIARRRRAVGDMAFGCRKREQGTCDEMARDTGEGRPALERGRRAVPRRGGAWCSRTARLRRARAHISAQGRAPQGMRFQGQAARSNAQDLYFRGASSVQVHGRAARRSSHLQPRAAQV